MPKKKANDVFFEAWEGPAYNSRIGFDANGNVRYGRAREKRENKAKYEHWWQQEHLYKVMVLGLEHYCKENDKHCENSTDEQNFYTSCLKRIQNDLLATNKPTLEKAANYLSRLHNRLATQIQAHVPALLPVYDEYNDKLYALHRFLRNSNAACNPKTRAEFQAKCGAFAFLTQETSNLIQQMENKTAWADLFLLSMALERVFSVHGILHQIGTASFGQDASNLLQNELAAATQLAGRTLHCKMHRPCQTVTCEDNCFAHCIKPQKAKYPCAQCRPCTQCTKCFRLPVCRKMTVREIFNFTQKTPESDSHKTFREAFASAQPAAFWSHVVFANFMQRGMPNEKSSHNASYRSQPNEQQRAAAAFAQNFKRYRPNILFVWGVEGTGILLQQKDILAQYGVSIRLNNQNQIPRILIEPCNKFEAPFTVLELKDKNQNVVHSCLMVLISHPSFWNQKKGIQQKFAPYYIQCFFTYFDNFMKWDETDSNFDPQKPCRFTTSLVWQNQLVFPQK